MKRIILILILLFAFSKAYSNLSDTIIISDSKNISTTKKIHNKTLPDTTYDCVVFVSPNFVYKNVNLFGLKDSTVRILNGDKSKAILIKDINSIKFNARGFWTGAAIGGAIGFALGALIGANGLNFTGDGPSNGSFGLAIAAGILLATPFSLIGGGFGALFADEHFYDLSKLDYDSKRIMIGNLIKEYSDK